MAFSQSPAYNELLQNFHMISFFKNFPTNLKSKIINGSYESINTYAILLAWRSEPVIHQRPFINPAHLLSEFSTLETKLLLPGTTASLSEKYVECWGGKVCFRDVGDPSQKPSRHLFPALRTKVG